MADIVSAPPVSVGAVMLNGKPTCVFPPRPYTRVVILVDMQNSVRGAATFYRGTPAGAFTRIFQTLLGQSQQWTTPIKIPTGQGCYIQWEKTPSDLTTVRGTITWKELR